MKPQTATFLAAADRALSNANQILTLPIPDQAARIAYYAQFHAAQALIFERTDKCPKTHKGVDRQFHLLATSDAGLGKRLAADLSTAYRFKEIADYDVGATSSVTSVEAIDAVAVAALFVETVRQSLLSI